MYCWRNRRGRSGAAGSPPHSDDEVLAGLSGVLSDRICDRTRYEAVWATGEICAQHVPAEPGQLQGDQASLVLARGAGGGWVWAPPRQAPPGCASIAVRCRGWSTTVSTPTRASRSRRRPWATCGGDRPNRRRRGPACARPRSTGPTACRDGSARPRPTRAGCRSGRGCASGRSCASRTPGARRSGAVGRLPVRQRLASRERRASGEAAGDGLDLRRRVHGRLERLGLHLGDAVREAGRRAGRANYRVGRFGFFAFPALSARAS